LPPNVRKKLGDAYKQAGELEAAIITYKKAIQLNPKKAQFHNVLGDAYLKAKNASAAISTYQTALEINPDLPPNVRKKLGDAYKQAGDLEAAISSYEKAIQLNPKKAQFYNALGDAYLKAKNASAAISAYQTALEINPDLPPNVRKKLGDAYKQAGDLESAINSYENAIQLNPKDINVMATLRLEMGRVQWQYQNYELALSNFHQAIAINPKRLDAKIATANLLSELEQFSEAETFLKEVLSLSENNLLALIKLGQIKRKEGDQIGALEYFEIASQHHPKTLSPYLQQIDTLLALNRLEELEFKLKTLLENHPQDSRVLIKRGLLARHQNERQEALSWFQLAQEKAANAQQTLVAQKRIVEELQVLEHLQEALNILNEIIKEYPDDVNALMILAQLQRRKFDLTKAIETYQTILQLKPEHTNSRLELGKLLVQLGRWSEAIDTFKTGSEMNPTDTRFLLQMGQIAQKEENWDEARQWYQKAHEQSQNSAQVYCQLAEAMFRDEEVEEAISLLQEATILLPNEVQINLKLASLKQRLGQFEESREVLEQAQAQFPHKNQIMLNLSRLHIKMGNLEAASQILAEIKTDHPHQCKQIEIVRGDIAFRRLKLEQAKLHYHRAIALIPTRAHPGEQTKLAQVLMLEGQIDTAYEHLQQAATEKLSQDPTSKATPLRSHPAKLIDEFRLNPFLLKQLQNAQQQTGRDRILAFGEVVAQEPFYLGSALQLVTELRRQGIFTELHQTLAHNQTPESKIPKRIIQFWDSSDISPAVKTLSRSWQEFNPSFEYLRFSLQSAAAFIKQHYEDHVFRAFRYCRHPAMQADFFRLAYLYKNGGFYADADDFCRQSLDPLIAWNAELILFQEPFIPTIGNNFLGCAPNQPIIGSALDLAVESLLSYSAESAWFITGPCLITRALGSGLLPYLTQTNYQQWPRLVVLTTEEIHQFIGMGIRLPYKNTPKHWHYQAYQQQKTKVTSPRSS
ncbi:MAG: tetratricopeptide repeat protein, partial [Halothece sp. Uz-M2-17]|nr:tetratricopeptide repeat protein [Halothece sp. Uz-M2-17]